MENVIFIDAPSGAGKSEYISRKLEECRQNGLRTLYMSSGDMFDMMIMTAKMLTEGKVETPLLSFELDYDVIAVDDIDMFFSGWTILNEKIYGVKYLSGELLIDFAIKMAQKDKVVMLSGINMKNRVRGVSRVIEYGSEWIGEAELSAR